MADCPSGKQRLQNFKRYIGLAVGAYNLRRIGQELIAVQQMSIQSIDREQKNSGLSTVLFIYRSLHLPPPEIDFKQLLLTNLDYMIMIG
ncbi:MAG: hypothetical protein GH151_00705 [Bacteroidetes bacterium]|nr:hypothetical protein [Bacteroidota bacterium]